MTSTSCPRAIAWQMSQVWHGSSVGPFTQFRHLAKIRAIEVLPTPRVPQKRYAWAIRFSRIALRKDWTTWSWPTTSSNRCGR